MASAAGTLWDLEHRALSKDVLAATGKSTTHPLLHAPPRHIDMGRGFRWGSGP